MSESDPVEPTPALDATPAPATEPVVEPMAAEAEADSAESVEAVEAVEAVETSEAAETDEAGVADTTPADPATPGMTPAQCGEQLAARFPALFGPEGPRKPIKLRIQADLQLRAPGVFTKRVLGLFLSRYTTSTAYLKGLSTAATRFDLDGQPAGEIAEEHRSAATAELARRKAIVDERRATERAAARAAQGPRAERPAGAAPTGDRPPRADRPPRGPRPDGAARGPRPAGPGNGPRPDRPDRGPRPEGQARPDRPSHPPQADQRPRPDRPPRADNRPDNRPEQRRGDRRDDRPDERRMRPPMPDAAPREPEDPARRDRAVLLRQFESSPLTKANFCVLRRISEAELDTQLALARAERPGPRR
ncbi:MAG: ProQ/FinO family protein [Rubrivivax sp.]|nr:ProQ/FinO family protein [Rubrivivax sp.]